MADPSSSDLRILSFPPNASRECGSPIGCEPPSQSGPQRSVSLRKCCAAVSNPYVTDGEVAGYLGGMDEDMNLEHGNNGDALEIEEELRFCETQSDMSRCA